MYYYREKKSSATKPQPTKEYKWFFLHVFVWFFVLFVLRGFYFMSLSTRTLFPPSPLPRGPRRPTLSAPRAASTRRFESPPRRFESVDGRHVRLELQHLADGHRLARGVALQGCVLERQTLKPFFSLDRV
jgi:hypothetical protein